MLYSLYVFCVCDSSRILLAQKDIWIKCLATITDNVLDIIFNINDLVFKFLEVGWFFARNSFSLLTSIRIAFALIRIKNGFCVNDVMFDDNDGHDMSIGSRDMTR